MESLRNVAYDKKNKKTIDTNITQMMVGKQSIGEEMRRVQMSR